MFFCKIDPEHSHETFFFSFKFFFFDHRFFFFEALELIDMHNNDGFFKSWLGNMGVALPGRHATPTSLDQFQVVVAKTKHAALFFS